MRYLPRMLQFFGHFDVSKMFLFYKDMPIQNYLLLPASARDFPDVSWRSFAILLPVKNLMRSSSSITSDLTLSQVITVEVSYLVSDLLGFRGSGRTQDLPLGYRVLVPGSLGILIRML